MDHSLTGSPMRFAFAVTLSLVAAHALGAEAVAPRRAASDVAKVAEALGGLLPTPPPAGIQAEPAGDVTVEFSRASRSMCVLAEAQRAEQERDWPRAAELYQRLLDEAPNDLCNPTPRLYVPVRAFVEERLSMFPPEGLAAYRQQVSQQAEQLYAAAAASGDASRFESVAQRFLLSPRGDEALDRLATAWLARGEAGRAFRAWRRLLQLCPDTDVAPGPLAAKLAVCLVELGHRDEAEAFLARVAKALGPAARVTVAGQETDLASFAAALPRPTRGAGEETAQTPVRPGALLWSDAVYEREAVRPTGPPRIRTSLEVDGATEEPSVRVLPILGGVSVLYPTRKGIASRDLASGKLRWDWPWPEDAAWRVAGPFSLPSLFVGHWACSADADSVYCSIPFQFAPRRNEQGMAGDLVALDARKGTLRWRRSATELLPPDRATGGWFVSAPLPRGERLWVGMRGGAAGDEYHVCCLRANDGQVVWRTFVAGRQADPLYWVNRYQPWFEGMPAEGRGLVVACSGGGVVAAVEAASGAVRWLARYDQAATRRSGWRFYPRDGWRSWTPLVAGGIVYATPADSDFLYAMDLDTGSILWRFDRADHRYLAGVRDGRAWVVGSTATCVGARGEVLWQASLPSQAIGRPALAGHVLHVPLAGGVLFLDAATGSELAWTAWADWTTAHGPAMSTHVASGDLLVAAGRLFVATPFALNVFAPFERRESIERQLAANPDDPVALYARGQECHWAGDASGAAESLEKVLALAGRKEGSVAAAVVADARRRLADCYADLSRRHEQAGRTDLALAACEAGLRYVSHGTERQALQLRVAALARMLRRWPAVVSACQEVLGSVEPGAETWQKARTELDAVLREAGREAYAPFEAAATASLERGAEQDLVAIVKRYPNSLAAPESLRRLADAADRAGRAAEARLWLHQLVRDYPEADAVPAALHQLAIRYAREGAVAMARGALDRLRRSHPQWRPGGDAAEALDVDAFLAKHAPGGKALAAPVKPPFGVLWDVRPSYGAAQVSIVGSEMDAGNAFFTVAGRSFECRAVETGEQRWADRPGWIGVRIVDADRRGGGVRIVSTVGAADDFRVGERDGTEKRVPGAEGDGTPAERAGLRSGDVLLTFDGRRLRDAQDLITTCIERRGGATVRLEFLRDEEVRTVDVKLGERPSLSTDSDLPPVSFVGVAGGCALLRKPSRVDAIRLERGDIAWSFPIEDAPRPPESPGGRGAAAGPGIAVLADARGRLVAVAPALGRQLWASQLDEPAVHDLALWDYGLVAATSRPATVRLLSAFDGRVLFHVAERHAVGAPLFALDTRGRLCYAMGSAVGCYDAARQQVAWATRIASFTARRLWLAGPAVVAHGVDDQGVEVVECRQIATGAPAWSLALARGERMLLADLAPDAFYLASRQGARVAVRRLDASTGQVAWTHTLGRQEDLASWDASGASLVLGLGVVSDDGLKRAEVVALDKPTGAAQQRLAIGMGMPTTLRRIGGALYAVVEDDAGVPRRPQWFGGDVPGQPTRCRIVRLNGTP